MVYIEKIITLIPEINYVISILNKVNEQFKLSITNNNLLDLLIKESLNENIDEHLKNELFASLNQAISLGYKKHIVFAVLGDQNSLSVYLSPYLSPRFIDSIFEKLLSTADSDPNFTDEEVDVIYEAFNNARVKILNYIENISVGSYGSKGSFLSIELITNELCKIFRVYYSTNLTLL